jgi:cobalt/nickel transport system permease protein
MRRLAVELPFVAFAIALPFIGIGPHRDVAGLSLSIPGCWAAWNILAKATLCGAATIVLTWSTPVADLLTGMDRLYVPRAMTTIAGFMVRYLDVVGDELHRLQIARVSRADDPRWIWQGRAVAATAGTMFVRAFERGERVQQAMLARGFEGRFHNLGSDEHNVPRRDTLLVVSWTVIAVAVAASAQVVRM